MEKQMTDDELDEMLDAGVDEANAEDTADEETKQGVKDLQEGVARGQKLMNECVKFRFTISEFSSSKGFDAQTKEEIAAVTGMKKAAVGGSKKLYDSGCDPIKNARAVLHSAKSLVDGLTIPLEHFKGTGKDAGYRLLEIEKADGLEAELEAHRHNIQAAMDRLNNERETILEASRKLLGPKFNRDDYPDTFLLEIDWHVEPAFLPEYMATIMPNSFKRAMNVAEQTFERTAQAAVEEFMEDFLGVVKSWSDRLGPKVKIYPDEGHELHHLRGAEILERQTHESNPLEVPKLPAGRFRLLLGHKAKGSRKRTDTWTKALSQSDYAELHPDEDTLDKKTFKNSTIHNLTDVISKFRNVGEMLGSPAGFNDVVNKISAHLAGMGDANEVAKELRDSKSYRASTVALMSELGDKLEGEIVEVKKKRRKIRSIN
jgi:hypothetical protein